MLRYRFCSPNSRCCSTTLLTSVTLIVSLCLLYQIVIGFAFCDSVARVVLHSQVAQGDCSHSSEFFFLGLVIYSDQFFLSLFNGMLRVFTRIANMHRSLFSQMFSGDLNKRGLTACCQLTRYIALFSFIICFNKYIRLFRMGVLIGLYNI